MNDDRLALAENFVAFDTETHLVQPGLDIPPIVLGSVATYENKKIVGTLLTKVQARQVWAALLADPKYTIVGAKLCYDALVMALDAATQGRDIMPETFRAYDPTGGIVHNRCEGRMFDVQLAENLHAIAQGHLFKDPRTGRAMDGRMSLQAVVSQALGRDNAKANDRYRLSYALFDNWALEDLPPEAKTYPVDDVVNTVEAGLAQAGHLPVRNSHDWIPYNADSMVCTGCRQIMTPHVSQDCMVLRRRRNINDLSRQAYTWLAMSAGAAWGFRVNQKSVDELEERHCKNRPTEAIPFIEAGIMRPDGTENQSVLKRLMAQAHGSKDPCKICAGTGKVPSVKTEGRTKVNCKACDGTALELAPGTPRSPKDGIAKGRDQLQESGSELLEKYGEYSDGDKIESTYIPLLRSGRACLRCGQPGAGKRKHAEDCLPPYAYREIAMTLHPNPLVETGRCSYEKGTHGLPRKGGVRECIEARPGYVFSSEDYQAGELVTLSQVCRWMVGYSKLGDALNLGLDAHLALAGTMTGRDYAAMLALKAIKDKDADNSRQAAKAANFGFPGGMAELTFVLRKRSEPGLFTPCIGGPDWYKGVQGYKGLRPCILMDGATICGEYKIFEYHGKPCDPVCPECVKAAKRLREYWFKQWPEMNPKDGYFAKIKAQVAINGPSGSPEVKQFQVNRIRAGVGFCDGANGYFQALLADAMKNAFCQIYRECADRTWRVENGPFMTSLYAGGPSPLFGSHQINLAHDETMIEHPESIAHEGAMRASEIMVESLSTLCPDQAKSVKAEPTLMRRLHKSAEPVYARGGKKPADAYDRLIPWEP